MSLKDETLAMVTEQMRTELLKRERLSPRRLLSDARFLLTRWAGEGRGGEREVALQVAALAFVALEALECDG